MKKINALEQLQDPNNRDNIILYSEDGKPCEFQQIAIIPIANHIYVILRPIESTALAEDEALVFEIKDDENGVQSLEVIDNDFTIDMVYEEYDRLLKEIN